MAGRVPQLAARRDWDCGVGAYCGAVPVEFLSDVEVAAYGGYDGGPSREELDRVFFLDDADRTLVDRRRGEHN